MSISTINVQHLPSSNVTVTDWMNGYLKSKNASKQDFIGIGVSLQILIAELFEEIEVLCTQVTNSAIPSVKEDLAKISKQIDDLRSGVSDLRTPKSLGSSELTERLEQISALNRARSNIDAVKQRL